MEIFMVISALLYLGLFLGAYVFWARPIVREQRNGPR